MNNKEELETNGFVELVTQFAVVAQAVSLRRNPTDCVRNKGYSPSRTYLINR
jgi:hypothetical protein